MCKETIKIRVKSPANRQYKRYREFKSLNKYNTAVDAPPINMRESQMTFNERLIKEGYRQSIDKSKWLSTNDFKARVGVASTGNGFALESPTYVVRDPSKPPSLFKFREVSHSKWIGSSFKWLVCIYYRNLNLKSSLSALVWRLRCPARWSSRLYIIWLQMNTYFLKEFLFLGQYQ